MANLGTLFDRHMQRAHSKGVSGSQLAGDRLIATTSADNSVTTSITGFTEPAESSPELNSTTILADNSSPELTQSQLVAELTNHIPQASQSPTSQPQSKDIVWPSFLAQHKPTTKSSNKSTEQSINYIEVTQPNWYYSQEEIILLPAVVGYRSYTRDTYSHHQTNSTCYQATVYFDDVFNDTIQAFNDCLDDTVEGPPLCHYLSMVLVRFLRHCCLQVLSLEYNSAD